MQKPLAYLAVEALNAARRWALSRFKLRQVLDSKTATAAAVEKAKLDYRKNSDGLEKLMLDLEKHLAENGQRLSAAARAAPGSKSPFPWKSFLGAVAEGAKALEQAVSKTPMAGVSAPASDGFIRAEVVNVTEKSKT